MKQYLVTATLNDSECKVTLSAESFVSALAKFKELPIVEKFLAEDTIFVVRLDTEFNYSISEAC